MPNHTHGGTAWRGGEGECYLKEAAAMASKMHFVLH